MRLPIFTEIAAFLCVIVPIHMMMACDPSPTCTPMMVAGAIGEFDAARAEIQAAKSLDDVRPILARLDQALATIERCRAK